MLNKNEVAPDFELFATPDQKLSLHELRGKNVILAFQTAARRNERKVKL